MIMVLEEIYEQPAKHAKNTNRPAFKQMLERVKKGGVYAVITYKMDRLSRNDIDFYNLAEMYDSYGTRLIYTNDITPEPTPGGNFINKINMAHAIFEREQKAERIADKYLSSIKNGIKPGRILPLGYKRNLQTGIIRPVRSM